MSKAVEKVAGIAEKNAQWAAMGLGVLFLGYMGFKYFGSQPSATVGGQQLGAGEIDRVTSSQQASSLEGKINGSQPVKFEVPTFDGKFRDLMSGPTTQPVSSAWTTAFPLDLQMGEAPTAPTPAPAAQPREQLPAQLTELAAPLPLGTTMGMSTVSKTTLVAAAAQQPVQPGAGGAALPAGAVDMEWVTAGYEIPMNQIVAEFQAAQIPVGLQTCFLRVVLEREEMMGDGKWGNRVTVPPLAGGGLALNPMPSAGNAQAEGVYLEWAKQNQVEILQPGFYSVLAGQAWKAPGSEPVAKEGEAVFDPLKYLTGPIPAELTKEQRDAVIKARQEAAQKKEAEERQKRAERAKSRGGGGGNSPYPPPGGGFGPPGGGYNPGRPGGGGGVGGGGARRYEPRPAVVMGAEAGGTEAVLAVGSGLGVMGHGEGTTLVQGVPPRPPYLPPGVPWPPPGYRGPNTPGTFPGNEPMPGGENPGGGPPIQNNLGQVPSGLFDPLTWQGAAPRTFQHDETIQPGKTYRYRAKYVIYNPVYGQANAVANKALAQQFGWESKWSDWGAEVGIPPKVSFFVSASPSNGASSLAVEVFRYIKGQMRSQKYSVSPGDVIGANDANGDFNTGYVLVDIRSSSNGAYALVMGPDGKVTRKNGKEDRTVYEDMKKMLPPPAAAPAGATGPGSGGPNGG